MIIKRARKAIEQESNKKRHVDPNCNWLYLSVTIKNTVYRIVFEHNPFYGYSVRQWLINDQCKTTVKQKYFENELVSFDASGGLCGIRNFENNSIVWEFLFKPMGLKTESFNQTGRKRFLVGRKRFLVDRATLLQLLKDTDIKYKINFDTIY